MRKELNLILIVAAICLVPSVFAHSISLSSNQTFDDGSVSFYGIMGIEPWSSESSYQLSLKLEPLQNQTSVGDMSCTFLINATILDGCEGMSLTSVGFEDVETNDTSDNSSSSVDLSHAGQNNLLFLAWAPYNNFTSVQSEDGSLDEGDGTANQSALWGRYFIVVNRSYYEAGEYQLTFMFEEVNKSTHLAALDFTFPANKPTETLSFSAEPPVENEGGHGCSTQMSCSEWGACINGEQTRACTEIQPGCYVYPSSRLATTRSCVAAIEPLSTPVETAPSSIFSRITGAVIGASGPVKFTGVIIFLAALAGAFVYLRVRAYRMPPHAA